MLKAPVLNQAYYEWLERFEALPPQAQSEVADALSSKSLELYINSTEQCNFRCTYCYESFRLGRMSDEVQRRLQLLITQKMKGRTKLYLNWFGGEPLIAADIVESINHFAQELCKSSGATFFSGASTNAYNLTPELLERLVKVGLTFFQITLDGDETEHDLFRLRADGGNTFRQIWGNLTAMKSSKLDFRVLLRIHLRPGCERSVRQLLERYALEIGEDSRFEIGFHSIRDLGGPQRGNIPTLNEADTITLYDSLTNGLIRGASLYGTGIEKDERPKPAACGLSVCYACKPNAFLIRSDGRVGKCTVALEAPNNTVGVLSDDGSILLDGPKHKLWTQTLVTLDPGLLSCPSQTPGLLGPTVSRG